MKKIVILGGGISGLSALWNLKKKYGDHVSITLLEKTERLGGLIQTVKKDGFLFERGPHSFRTKGGRATLQLIEELSLEDEIIPASPQAQRRFLYVDKKLQEIPTNFLSMLFSPLTRRLLPKLLMEWTVSKGLDKDESIYSFFSRRFGKEITETFVDPLISGIYAGNMHQLSVKSCFPQFFQWERQSGSITKGALLCKFSKKPDKTSSFIKKMKKVSLFSFKEGMETLPRTLAKRLETHILTNHEVFGLNFSPKKIHLQVNGKIFEADEVVSTLPPQALASLIQPHHCKAAKILMHIPSMSIAVVGLGYKQKVLSLEGFGYLIPSKEKENILGMIWDSSVFPENINEKTQLTVMIGIINAQKPKTENQYLDVALEAVSNHLKINKQPDSVDVYLSFNSIPQYCVGHEAKTKDLENALKNLNEKFSLLGSGFYGVSLNDCILNLHKMGLRE